MSAGMLELTHLEAMLEGEAGCEARHGTEGVPPCSEVVTHRADYLCTVKKTGVVCLNVARAAVEAIARNATCDGCGEPTSTHWRVVPV